MNQDNSHSWVRISHGTVKYVIDSIQDNTEIPADPQEEQVSQTSTSVVAARSKAKSKPQPRVLVGTTTTIPIHERRWIDIEPSKQNLASYGLSKKMINLLRHNQTLQREEDGAIEFYKIEFHLRNHHSQIHNWSDDRWKACLAAGGGSKRRYQYCSDNSGTILYLRALQGHSGNNLIDPTLQEKVVIGTGRTVLALNSFCDRSFTRPLILFFSVARPCSSGLERSFIPLHLPRRMHIQSSFYYQQWIGTWRSRFEQKTNSVLLAC